MTVGVRPLGGLRDVRNQEEARLQNREETCGLFAVASVLDDIDPGGGPRNFSGARDRSRANQIAHEVGGLDSFDLSSLLGRNLSEDTAVLIERDVTESRLLDFLGRGHVIAHVDGNHWVRVLAVADDGGAPWLRIYDPARGRYEQRLSSFMTRAGLNNQMVWVRP